jgi:hypothetical protein
MKQKVFFRINWNLKYLKIISFINFIAYNYLSNITGGFIKFIISYTLIMKDEIAINIWNWDVKWKVEWYENGELMGMPQQRIAKDPWAVELYEGPNLPKKHKFVEPSLTEHLFFITPSANAKTIKVKATDRFGNVYEEEVKIN